MVQTNKMWTTFLIASTLLIASECQDSLKLEYIFGDSTSKDTVTIDGINCVNIEGTVRDCFSCFLCDNPRLKQHQNITLIKMTDSSCETTEICCFPQSDLVARNRGECGDHNPEGYPRSVRNSLRSVLQGEYPWRAWVYLSADKSKPLCSATYVSGDAKGFITSASCVQNYNHDQLSIRFSKTGAFLEVEKKFIHEEFQANNHHNDIAFLSLKSLDPTPKWIKPCCLPSEMPQFGTRCTAVSSDDYFINAKIPKEKYCINSLKKDYIHDSVMCAIAPKNDYTPETGSALMCLDEHEKKPKYIVHGIALQKIDTESTLYTNVSKYLKWIDQKIEEVLEISKNHEKLQ